MTAVQPENKPSGKFKAEIHIDREHFVVEVEVMTGSQLRLLPTPPIGPDRDLFEVVPGGADVKIANDKPVQLRNGQRFFSAPAHINPGRKAE